MVLGAHTSSPEAHRPVATDAATPGRTVITIPRTLAPLPGRRDAAAAQGGRIWHKHGWVWNGDESVLGERPRGLVARHAPSLRMHARTLSHTRTHTHAHTLTHKRRLHPRHRRHVQCPEPCNRCLPLPPRRGPAAERAGGHQRATAAGGNAVALTHRVRTPYNSNSSQILNSPSPHTLNEQGASGALTGAQIFLLGDVQLDNPGVPPEECFVFMTGK
jgi:hypothetical protein